jgi:hypothetical protein
MSNDLWRLGAQYEGTPLDPADCDPDPIVEFRRWFQRAVDAQLPSVNAMTLATVDERGRPAARIVLLKEVDAGGFVFFTNYDSRKGRDLAAHPFAALVLFWEPLHRQVRVEGAISRVAAQPDRRDRLAAVAADREPRGAGAAGRRGRTRGGRRGPGAPRSLGWLPPGPRHDRAVAGPAIAAPRSRALPARRAGLAARPPGTVSRR